MHPSRMSNDMLTDRGQRDLFTLREKREERMESDPLPQRESRTPRSVLNVGGSSTSLPNNWTTASVPGNVAFVRPCCKGVGVALQLSDSGGYRKRGCLRSLIETRNDSDLVIDFVDPGTERPRAGFTPSVFMFRTLGEGLRSVVERPDYDFDSVDVVGSHAMYDIWNALGGLLGDVAAMGGGDLPLPSDVASVWDGRTLPAAVTVPDPTVHAAAIVLGLAFKLGWRYVSRDEVDEFFAKRCLAIVFDDSVVTCGRPVSRLPGGNLPDQRCEPPTWVTDLADMSDLTCPDLAASPTALRELVTNCTDASLATVLTLVISMATKAESYSAMAYLAQRGATVMRAGSELVIAEVLARMTLGVTGSVGTRGKRGYAPSLCDCVSSYILPPTRRVRTSVRDGFCMMGETVYGCVDGVPILEYSGRIEGDTFAVSSVAWVSGDFLLAADAIEHSTPVTYMMQSSSGGGDTETQRYVRSPLGLRGPGGEWANYSVTCVADLSEGICMPQTCVYEISDREYADSSVGLSLMALACIRASWDKVRASLPYAVHAVDALFKCFPYVSHFNTHQLLRGGGGTGPIPTVSVSPMSESSDVFAAVSAAACVAELACGRMAVWGREGLCYAGHLGKTSGSVSRAVVSAGGADLSRGFALLTGSAVTLDVDSGGAKLVLHAPSVGAVLRLSFTSRSNAHCTGADVVTQDEIESAISPGPPVLGLIVAGKSSLSDVNAVEKAPRTSRAKAKISRKTDALLRVYDRRRNGYCGLFGQPLAEAGAGRDEDILVIRLRASLRETNRIDAGLAPKPTGIVNFIDGRYEVTISVRPGSFDLYKYRRSYRLVGTVHVEPSLWYCRITDVDTTPQVADTVSKVDNLLDSSRQAWRARKGKRLALSVTHGETHRAGRTFVSRFARVDFDYAHPDGSYPLESATCWVEKFADYVYVHDYREHSLWRTFLTGPRIPIELEGYYNDPAYGHKYGYE